MLPIKAQGVYIKKEAYEDTRSMARIQRMLPFIRYQGEPVVIDDAGWNKLVCDARLNQMPAHGLQADTVEPIVVFNQFLYDHTPEQREQRKQQYPEISSFLHYSGYSGWDWRPSGDEEFRRTTGLVCQPAYAIHSFWGCHFRCAYCNLGNVANVFVNLEDWVEHIREGLANLENSPNQTLFQWDNGTDIVCFEPEYGGTKMLIDLFAGLPDKYLELYVGKSDYVDFMLDYDHKGHTTCCWSLSMETQQRETEKRTASLDGRLESARKCQEAGYPVRMRFSPMIPVVGWEKELRNMVRRMFEETDPEVITIEPLRFNTYEQLCERFQPGLIDSEFLESMRTIPEGAPEEDKYNFPTDKRVMMYKVVIDEVARISPHTPVGLCREKRTVWETLKDDFARMGQDPDNYVCNCGPTSTGNNPLLAANRKQARGA